MSRPKQQKKLNTTSDEPKLNEYFNNKSINLTKNSGIKQNPELSVVSNLPYKEETNRENENEKEKEVIKRTKKHQAILKILQVQNHIDMMKRRQKLLQVKDQQNRSKTIQHQKKIKQHQQLRLEIKKDKQSIQKSSKLRMYEIQTTKQKNQNLKQSIQKKISDSVQKMHHEKIQGYHTIKKQQEKNAQKINRYKQSHLKQKQQRKKSINLIQQNSKVNISRYKQNKQKQIEQQKAVQFEYLIQKANKKEKQLAKLSRIEEEMIKKNSESLQASQLIRNKLRSVLGDERRFTRLPSINGSKSSNSPMTRGSTGITQLLAS